MEDIDYPTMDDLRDKVDWEGGIYETLIYGIHPDQVPEEIREDWKKAVEAVKILERVEDRLWNTD
jgi:hypothetical protein